MKKKETSENKHFRIAMLGHKRIPSREGGVEIVVEELSTRMAAMGHDVTCFNRSGHHVSGREFDQSSLSEYKGVKLKKVLTIDAKGLAAMTSSFFGAIRCAFGKFDVVHFHAEGPCAFIWLPKLFGKRVVATIHGLDWQRDKWHGFAKKYIHFGEKMATKYADELIVLSRGVQDYFLKEYNRDTVFIPNGVEKPEELPAKMITEKYGLHKDDYILFLGRIVPEKGVRYLIDAFKQLHTDKKLVIAGGSSDTEDFYNEMKALAQGDERIIFTGFVQGQLLSELYSNAYIYCLPSDLEGMPLSLLEAMSYGNCCVTSDIDECAEVVENKAVTFAHSDTEALQNTLQTLCDEPEQVSIYKKEATEFICHKYNWDKVVKRTLEMYE